MVLCQYLKGTNIYISLSNWQDLVTNLTDYLFSFQCFPLTYPLVPGLHVVFLILNAMMWYNLHRAYNRDPGFLPKNTDDYDRAIRQVRIYVSPHVKKLDEKLGGKEIRPIQSLRMKCATFLLFVFVFGFCCVLYCFVFLVSLLFCNLHIFDAIRQN